MWPLPVVGPSERDSLGLLFRQGNEEFSARITCVTLPARPAAVFYCGALGLFAFCPWQVIHARSFIRLLNARDRLD